MKYLLLIIISTLSLSFYGQIKDEHKIPHKSYSDSLYENTTSETIAWLKAKSDTLNQLIDKYSKLIEQNSKDDKAYYMRANAKEKLIGYLKEDNYTEHGKKVKIICQDEINDLTEVTKLNSKYADTAYFKIYGVKQRMWISNRDSAVKSTYYLEKAVALNPKYTIAWFCLANLYYNNDKRAIECYTKVIELKDTLLAISAYQRRAQCKRNLKDYKGALADLTNATKVHRVHFNFYNIYFDRGLIKYEIQDYKGAIEDYTKTIDLVPKNTTYYYYRGDAKLKVGDKQGACLDWDKAKDKEMIDRKLVNVTDTINKYCK
jgi:tetratricopeptide (TPR) repeat protein